MAALTLVYVALAVLVDEGTSQTIEAILAVLAFVFFLEFAVRFLDADSRLEYLRAHWIDLVTCLPAIGPLRLLRLLRLVGLLRLAHQVRNIAYLESENKSSSSSSLTWVVWPTALLLLGLLGFISAQLTARWLRTERREIAIDQELADLTLEIRALRQMVLQLHGGPLDERAATAPHSE